MSAGIFGQWRKQTADLGEKRYYSPVGHKCIWRPGDKVTKSMRRPQVTDRELLRRRGEPAVDCFGNLLTEENMARIVVEREMLGGLTAQQQARVAPRLKWELVELIRQGYVAEAINRLIAAVQPA